MSMLAGPRRKQKVINLRAKNSEWSNDSNKFGQRMLEKMGWTSGKGLGANENGIVEHVVARYKNDEKGLGFEDKNDQWTKHEDDFNSLLANLSNANDDTEIKLHSGISLEDKSKKSKARIHYHKFTRGKDLSKYSEKDLANIFGKKSFKANEQIETPINDDVETNEQIFTEKGSMEDYFKSKMAAFESKNMMCMNNDEPELDWEDELKCGFQGFTGTKNNEHIPSINFEDKNYVENGTTTKNDILNTSKTKKQKKKKHRVHSQEEIFDNEAEAPPEVMEKSKKKQKKDGESQMEDTLSEIHEQKLSKKRKQISAQQCDKEQSLHKPKKKKKRKNKDL